MITFVCRFNSAGTLLLSCSLDKTNKIWDMQGNCIKTLAEHSRYINCLAINLNSMVFASGSNDRSLLIWDLTSTLTIRSHLTGARSMLFNLASSTNEMPLDFVCPITHEVMKNPVLAEGFFFQRVCIEFKNIPIDIFTIFRWFFI